MKKIPLVILINLGIVFLISGCNTKQNSLSVEPVSPPIITNTWESGMGNTNSTLVTPGSYWVQDLGINDIGRWNPQFGAAISQNTNATQQSTTPAYSGRCYPLNILDQSGNFDANAPGIAFDGVWQINIKIGSNGQTSNPYSESFYLAERKNLGWGPENYSDGSENGGPAGFSREIDIMQTKYNGGSETQFGPQINLPNGGNTGWNPSSTYINTRMGLWSQVGGAPSPVFLTFGCYIANGTLWIYSYRPGGPQWYCSDPIPLNNPTYEQKYPFVPYIGTVMVTPGSNPGGFSTSYEKFVYRTVSQMAGKNPKDNPEAFGPAFYN